MKRKVLFCAVFAFIFTSCVKNTSEYKALRAENDSLSMVVIKTSTELDQIMGLLNDVIDNFQSIKWAENYLTIQSGKSDKITISMRDHIQNDMQFVEEILEKNRQQLDDLEEKLKQSSINSIQLYKTLDNLRKEWEEKTLSLAVLRKELAERNWQIAELTENVTILANNVKALSSESKKRQQVIDQQQAEINATYYFFGTSKELKARNLLVKGQLGTNFDIDHFIKINDLNTQNIIPLPAKSGKLISKHPDGTYEFVKDASGKVELHILDPKNFWSLTKYLVIEVKV